MFKVEFFEISEGNKPARDFLLSLDEKMRAKTLRNLKLLQAYGYNLREPYSKHITNGIFELRTQVGSDITRVLYFFYIGKKIILTNGFTKKMQKTPLSEINKALNYRQIYLQQKVVKDNG